MIKRINLYVFIQIFKSCTLVFFIFLSIAWLLQITRLFTYLSNFQVKFIDTLYLSIFLIPNLINVILPFIVIFGFVIAFIKLDKDNEIIAIFSLGISLSEIKKSIFAFLVLISIFYLVLNLFISPFIYDEYKKKEFNLRNLIDLNNINISNFLEIDNNLILDFTKEDNKFKDVFLSFKDKNENIIYASEASITQKHQEIIFNLINGFKLEFIEDKIEKLEFTNYKYNIPYKNNEEYNNIDKNTLTIFNLLNDKKYKIILEKIIESILIINIIIFFYYNNIKLNNFKLFNIFSFITISITILVMNNLIKNMVLQSNIEFIFNFFNIFLIFIYLGILKLKKLKK